MAIYAFGANYDSVDMTDEFVNNNVIGIGWSYNDNPTGHNFVKTLKAGDIVYIKSCNFGSDLTIKAVGIVSDYDIRTIPGIIMIGRNVKWISTEQFVISKQDFTPDKNNVRSNSLYEEFNPVVISRILEEF